MPVVLVPMSGVKLIGYLTVADGEILSIDVDIAGIDGTVINDGPIFWAVIDDGPIVGTVLR
jgi:hypothetical protein